MTNFLSRDAAFSETILIVGAGAAGLMAARELAIQGKDIILLEAAAEPGGRIRTLRGDGFVLPVEAGAEFIHGPLPLTLELLGLAGIRYHSVKGKMIRVRKGNWTGSEEGPQGWDRVMEKMQQLEEDMPLSAFLSTHFSENRWAPLREAVEGFAQGFDLADIRTASTMALYKEWSQEDHEQYRIEGGYDRLIDWLATECRQRGVRIHCASPVEKIVWEPGRVSLTTRGGAVFSGGKAIVAVPLGILQHGDTPGDCDTPEGYTPGGNREAIGFLPAIGDRVQAAREIGYGTVVKILLQFSEPFWNKREKELGFVISDEKIPVWWTQLPDAYPLLTGWMHGALLQQLGEIGEEDLQLLCLSSLASIFGMEVSDLQQRLTGIKIIDWTKEPFIRGGYSFETLGSAAARELLNQPVADTLYFAGEALYDGDSPATVEAALDSGKRVTEMIIARH